MSKIKGLTIFFVLAICFILTGPSPSALASEQNTVKALYLYNFLLFVDWPEDAVDEKTFLRVAVTGDNNLFELLKPLCARPIKGRKLVVEKLEAIEDLRTPYHVLFIGRSKRSITPRLLDKVRDQPVLTISDMTGFTDMGGMVYLKHLLCQKHTARHPKRFEINLAAVERAGLQVRSRLLRLSDIVNIQQHEHLKQSQ